MKKIFPLLLVFASLFGFSQNYEFIKTDGTYHFGNGNAYRIDSIIESDTGQLLYSYRRVYTIDNDYEGLLDPLTSWLGDQILLDNEGKTTFYNWSNHPFVFYSHYNIEEEWHAFDFENGNYVNAKFSANSEWMEVFSDLSDSVKTISFQVYNSNGEAITHDINEETMRLSQNHGMLDALYFIGIDEVEPYYLRNYHISGIDLQNESYGETYFFKETVSSLEIGSRMHFISYFDKDDEDPHYVSRSIADKNLTDNYCTYVYLDSILYQGALSISYSTDKWYIGALPYESMFPSDSFSYQGYMSLYSVNYGDKWDHNTYFSYHFWPGQNDIYNGDYIWFVDYWELNQGNQYSYRFIENVGSLVVGKGNDWHGDELVYYQYSGDEWGEPLDFEVGDYQPIRPDIVSYFGRSLTGDISYSDIKAIKTDSITGEFYYNTRSPEVLEYGDDFNYYDPYSSWIGKKTEINGFESTFENINGQKIYVHPQKNINIPWMFFQDDDGSYIISQVVMIAESEFLPGLTDSLKYITFQAFNSSNIAIENAINTDTIILSKNYGWVSTFYFAKFSMNEHPIYTLMGLEKRDEVYGFEWEFPSMVNDYQVDDEINLFTDEDNDLKLVIEDKQYYGDYVKYYCTQCEKNFNGSTSASQKTFTYNKNVLPGQTIIANGDGTQQGFYHFSLYRDLWHGRTQYLVRFYLGSLMQETEYNGQYAWAHQVNHTNSYNPSHNKSNSVWTFLYAVHEDRTYDIVYFDNEQEEWGEELDFTCNSGYAELENSQLNISPNPSNGNFSLTNNTSQKMEEIKIYNTNGKIVWQQEAQENEQQIDVSFLSTGLYLIKVHLEDSEVINRKLMIEK